MYDNTNYMIPFDYCNPRETHLTHYNAPRKPKLQKRSLLGCFHEKNIKLGKKEAKDLLTKLSELDKMIEERHSSVGDTISMAGYQDDVISTNSLSSFYNY